MHHLDPAPVPGTPVRRQLAGGAAILEHPVGRREGRIVLLSQGLANVEVHRAPDLPVRVGGSGLGSHRVVVQIAEVQRTGVHPEVADAPLQVSGHVGADREGVLSCDGHQSLTVQELRRRQVRPALSHGSALVATEPVVRVDHPVLDQVAVLVGDDGHVEVAVDAGRVGRTADGLPQVHVGDGGDAVVQGDLVGVVAAQVAGGSSADRTRLRIAHLRIVLPIDAGGAQVPELGVAVGLGETQEVGPVVHPVVLGEQVGDGGVDVVVRKEATGMGQHRRIAARGLPSVGPREVVVTCGAHGPVRHRRRQRAQP